jgi:hypothetical protein
VSGSAGQLLASARSAKGKTLAEAAAATRIRLRHLEALEADRYGDLPAPIYVRGYLKTYAAYLGLDAEDLVERYDGGRARESGPLAIRPMSPLVAPGLIVTAPVAAIVAGLLLLAGVTAYAYRDLESLRPAPALPQPAATLLPATASGARFAAPPAPSPTPRSITVTITASDTVWIDVKVDGKPQFADSGKILQPGDTVTFSGVKVEVHSGKGVATLINVDGKDLGPLGGGVTSKTFTAQT